MAAAGSTGDRLSLGVSGDTWCLYPLASGGPSLNNISIQKRVDGRIKWDFPSTDSTVGILLR